MFSLQLFGGAVLDSEDGAVTGPAAQRRRLALLTILALARGRPVGRERLIGLLWPEHPDAAARRLLSESLYVLRKRLGEGVFATGSDDVLLRLDAIRCDVVEFEEALGDGNLRAAARLYRGPFLEGVYVPNAPEFERWAEDERGRLARAFARAVEHLAEQSEAAGDLIEAADWWRKAIACDPYSSRVVLRLMQTLDAAGERAAALRTAEAHTTLLRSDLEVEPDAAVTNYVERLRAQPPSPSAVKLLPPQQSVLHAPGTPLADEPANAPSAADPVAFDGPARRTLVEPEHGRTRPAGRRQAFAAAIFGSVLGLWLSLSAVERGPQSMPHSARRIAVLYFEDLSPGDSLEYLANGLTQRLVHELAQVEALDVVSLAGVRPYRDRPVRFDSIAAQLRAGSIVQGSVIKDRGRVRVTVSLTDANTFSELESRSLEEDEEDLFLLLDGVVGQVAGFLRKRVGEEVRLSHMRTESQNAAAITLVLQAQQTREEAREMARTGNERDVASAHRGLSLADSLLATAEDADPRWPEPSVLRARLALDRALLSSRAEERGHLDEALAHAQRGVRLEPERPAALEVRGTALWRLVVAAPQHEQAKRWRELAERDLRQAVTRDPHLAGAWITLSQLLRANGNFAEAENAARRARAEDAYLAVSEVAVDRLYRMALAFAEYERAREWCRTGRRDFPADYRFWECDLTLLARDTGTPSSPDSALRVLQTLGRVDPPSKAVAAGRPYTPVYRQMMLAAVLARDGKSDRARAISAQARSAVAADSSLVASWYYDAAYVHLLLGDRRRSLALLDSFVSRNRVLGENIARDPLFLPLRH